MAERSDTTKLVLTQGSTGQNPAIHLPKFAEPPLKRPLDVILSLFMMILSVPFSLVVVLAIELEDGGPISYRQERWGKGGARFWAYKFRTMISTLDRGLWIRQASKGDPCITSVGRFLRAAGLDLRDYVEIDPRYLRPLEVGFLRGDASKAKRRLNWEAEVRFKELVRIMVDADLKELEEMRRCQNVIRKSSQ